MAVSFESSMTDFLLFDEEQRQPSSSAFSSSSQQPQQAEGHEELSSHQLVKQDLDLTALLSADSANTSSQSYLTSEADTMAAYYTPYYTTSDIPRNTLAFEQPQSLLLNPPSYYNSLPPQAQQNSYQAPSSPSSSSTSAEMFDFSAQGSVGSAPSVPSSDRGSPFTATEEWPMGNTEDVNVNIYNGDYTSWPGMQPWEQQPTTTEVIKADGFVGEYPHLINSLSRSASRQSSVDLNNSSPRVRRNTLRHSPYPPPHHSRSPSIVSSKGSPPHSLIEDVSFPDAAFGGSPIQMSREHSLTRRSTISSIGSPAGSISGSSTIIGNVVPSASNRDNLCLECNKVFRDLRAHQLTHQRERPEKCPIATCEYSKKGFARKYDCQRHTLTHYKGTMVCGFCPGSGLSTEKTFNRADVFKRHLMSVHNVEQTPPNGRGKKLSGVSSRPSSKSSPPGSDQAKSPSKASSPTSGSFPGFPKGVTGKCSTCGLTFLNAQQFYEHLDDCVLHKVVEAEPAAAINEANLDQVKIEDMEATLAAHGLLDATAECDEEDEEDDEDYETNKVPTGLGGRTPNRKIAGATARKGNGIAGR